MPESSGLQFRANNGKPYSIYLSRELPKRIIIGHPKWGFPKIRGTTSGVTIRRTIIFLGLYSGPLFREKIKNEHIATRETLQAHCQGSRSSLSREAASADLDIIDTISDMKL